VLEPTLDDYTTYAGAALGQGGVALLAKERDGDDPSDTGESPSFLFVHNDGAVSALQIYWHVRDICFVNSVMRQLICVGRRGRVYVAQSAPYEELVDGSAEGPLQRGALISSSLVGSHIYAVGMGRQVYRRTLDTATLHGTWSLISRDILAEPTDLRSVALAAIAGFSGNELYAGGWNGELFSFDGTVWREVALPTNLDLHALACEPTGRIVGVGQHGLILYGRTDRWAVFEQVDVEDDLWSCVHFAGYTWLASETTVYRFDEDLAPVSIADDPDFTAGQLTTDGKRLWSIGADHVFWTEDGQVWSQLRL
jgi:hypothetical protein